MHKRNGYSKVMAVIIGLVFVGLLSFTLFYLYRQSRVTVDRVIAQDIEMLHKIFTSIDETCEITGVVHNRNATGIDFLTIKEFSGNQIGALQVRFPDKWQGPYVQRTPMVQGKMYELVYAKDGYAIVPGKGVRLANGKIIGKDIVINASTPLAPYITEDIGLVCEGRPLAAQLTLRHAQITPQFIVNEEGV